MSGLRMKDEEADRLQSTCRLSTDLFDPSDPWFSPLAVAVPNAVTMALYDHRLPSYPVISPMAENPRVILSGFADEAANHKTAVEQFAAFAALGLQYYSLRFIDVGERHQERHEPHPAGDPEGPPSCKTSTG